MPKEQAPVVGPSRACTLCGRATSERTAGKCAQCWHLNQLLTAYVPGLLADEKVGPKVRALLEAALATKAEAPTTTGPA